MKKQVFLTYPLLIIVILLASLLSCEEGKDQDNIPVKDQDNIPVLTTLDVIDITHESAVSGGNIISDGGATVIDRGVCWSTGLTPTKSDNKTTDGTGAGNYKSEITGLEPETTYYVRAYATNKNGTGYGSALSFVTDKVDGFIDTRDGNIYKVMEIGDQIWMAENLRYLPEVVSGNTRSSVDPCYYVYGYKGTDVAQAKERHSLLTGVLYNWPAAMAGSTSSNRNPSGVQGVCPTGWHLPSYAEWYKLFDYLGGQDEATVAFNQVTALGGILGEGGFSKISEFGGWWFATEWDQTYGIGYMKSWDNSISELYKVNKSAGISVRCVKD